MRAEVRQGVSQRLPARARDAEALQGDRACPTRRRSWRRSRRTRTTCPRGRHVNVSGRAVTESCHCRQQLEVRRLIRTWASRPDSWNIRASCRWRGRRASASHDWNEFHEHADETMLAAAGRALHGLRRALLPHRHADRGHGVRLSRSTTSFPSGTISSIAACGRRRSTAAQDQQFPGVHRPRLPGAVRRLVRARHQRAAGHDQEHRVRHHRPGLRGRLGRARAARQCAPARRSPSSAPARRGWPPPPSSTGRPLGHRLRARRPRRRPAHVRHPQHEARQENGRSAASICWRRRASTSSPTARSARTTPPTKLRDGVRRRRPVRRRDQAARSADRRAASSRASTSRWSSCTPTPRACSTASTRTATTSRPRART